MRVWRSVLKSCMEIWRIGKISIALLVIRFRFSIVELSAALVVDIQAVLAFSLEKLGRCKVNYNYNKSIVHHKPLNMHTIGLKRSFPVVTSKVTYQIDYNKRIPGRFNAKNVVGFSSKTLCLGNLNNWNSQYHSFNHYSQILAMRLLLVLQYIY
jgi:hypothetical protein